MVWDWRVSREGPMILCWPMLLYPYYSLLLFFPFSSFCLLLLFIIKKKIGNARPGLPPYQSEDPSPTQPTYRGKEEKGKIVEDKKEESNQANKKALDLVLKLANPTPSNMGSTRAFQRDTERGIKVLRYCEVLQRGGA